MMRLQTRNIVFLFLFCTIAAGAGFSLFAQDTKENSEFKLAVNLYNDGMYDLAVQQLKNFIDAYPATANGIEARFYLGLTQMKLKKYDDARFTFQNFALSYTDHPKAPEAWINVGDAFAALHNEIEAAAAYERVKTFFPKSPLVPDALLDAARLYHRAGDRERAQKMLRTILEDYPKSASVYPARMALAELYLDEGEDNLAGQESRHIDESDAPAGIKASALSLLGQLQMHDCLFDDAGNTFRQTISSYPKTTGAATAAFYLGKLLLGNLKFTDAETQFQAVLASDAPDSVKAEAAYHAGEAALGERSFGNAIKYFTQVDSTFSTSPFTDDALYGAGKAAMLKGDYPAAIGSFEKLLAMPSAPAQRKGWIRLAETRALANQYTEAAAAYRSFLSHYPGDPASPVVLLRLGRLFEQKMRDRRKAAGIYSEIFQTYPRSHEAEEAMVSLGQCEESLGEYEGAVETYGLSLAEYPAAGQSFAIKDRIEHLQNHQIRQRDAAQDQLARLLGDMLLEKPRPLLSMRLADVYFFDLKDYRAAIEQYSSAIDKGLDENEFIAAYYNRARACHLLSDVDSTAGPKAITYYEAFIKQFPNDSLTSMAGFNSVLLRMKEQPSEDQSARIAALLSSPIESRFKEHLLFAYCTRSLNVANHVEQCAMIDTLKKEFPGSPYAQEGLRIAGQYYEANGHPDTAAICYTRAIDKTSNGYSRAAILQSLVNLKAHENDFAAAEEYASMLVKEFPFSEECLDAGRRLPSLLLAEGKFVESIAKISPLQDEVTYAIDDNADTLNLQYQLAVAYDKKGDKDNAGTLYRRFLQERRNSDRAAQAYYALGVLARAAGKTDIATAYFRQASAHGGQTGATVEIADLLFENEQYGEAARQYAELAQSNPAGDAKKLYLSRAVIATLRDDKLASAQQLMESFRKDFGQDKDQEAEFTYESGLYYYRQQSYQQANSVFEKEGDYKESRFYPWSLFYRAKILEVTNQPDEAVKRYDQLLQDYPASDAVSHVLLSLGNMHFNAERYDNAIKYYQTIIEKPDLAGDVLPFAMNNLIQAYESTKLYDAALKVTKDFIARFPNDESLPDKKIKIGLLYTKLGYYDQAVVHFQNLINESGSLLEAELRYDIGDALFQKGDYPQAILEFLKVPYLVSRQGKVNWTATSLYMAGQAYEKLSKFPQAMEMYQQIVDRTGIDASFKAAAKKEIARVKTIIKE